MNIFKLLNQSKLALIKENEIELAYFFGENLRDINYMKLKKTLVFRYYFSNINFFIKVLKILVFLRKIFIRKKFLYILGVLIS